MKKPSLIKKPRNPRKPIKVKSKANPKRNQIKMHTVWFSHLFGVPLSIENKTGKLFVDKRKRMPDVEYLIKNNESALVDYSKNLYVKGKASQRKKSNPFVSAVHGKYSAPELIKQRTDFLNALSKEKNLPFKTKTKFLTEIFNIEQLLDLPLHLRHAPENTENLSYNLIKYYKIILKEKSEFN